MIKIIILVLLIYTTFSYSQSPIHEYNFDGTLANQDRSATFFGNAQFTMDRFGNNKKALRVNNETIIANMDNLPQHNAPRTISIWVKFNDIANANYIWSYGTATNNAFCGLIHQGTSSTESSVCVAAWGNMNDFVTHLTLEKEVWYNYIYTYDGKIGSLYRDGVLIESFNEPYRNTFGSIFKIGNVNSIVSINADIDDIKIYNIALCEDEIKKTYALEFPSIRIENLKVALKKRKITSELVSNN